MHGHKIYNDFNDTQRRSVDNNTIPIARSCMATHIKYFGGCMNELVRKSTMIGALWLVVIEFVRLKKKISNGKNIFRRNYRATTNF